MKRFLILFVVLTLLVVGGGTVAAVPERFGISSLAGDYQAAPTGLLGIVAINLNNTIDELLGIDNLKGAVIIRVATGSPAATAGLKIRDIITAVNGAPVANVADLRKAFSTAAAQVTLTVLRDGATQTISVIRQPGEQWLLLTGPAWLPELTGIRANQSFAHYLGSTQSFLDKDSRRHTITRTPGVVTEVKENSLSITPNGQSSPAAFTVTDKTVINIKSHKLSDIKSGDKVVITTIDGSQEARLIAGGPALDKRFWKMDKFIGRML